MNRAREESKSVMNLLILFPLDWVVEELVWIGSSLKSGTTMHRYTSWLQAGEHIKMIIPLWSRSSSHLWKQIWISWWPRNMQIWVPDLRTIVEGQWVISLSHGMEEQCEQDHRWMEWAFCQVDMKHEFEAIPMDDRMEDDNDTYRSSPTTWSLEHRRRWPRAHRGAWEHVFSTHTVSWLVNPIPFPATPKFPPPPLVGPMAMGMADRYCAPIYSLIQC